MVKESQKWLLLLLICSIVQWGCRTEHDSLVGPSQNEITIDEARTWFETQSSKARVAGQAPSNRMVYWKYAKNEVLPNGTPVVVVPLLYGFNEPIIVGSEATTKQANKPAKLNVAKSDVRIQRKLIIAKEGANQYKSCVMVVYPSEKYRKNNKQVKRENFDGVVQLFDEKEENYLLGLEYKNGKLKRQLTGRNTSGGRMASPCYKGVYETNPPAMQGGGGLAPYQKRAEDNNIPMTGALQITNVILFI